VKTTEFPTLYKTASTGKLWSWTIRVTGNEIIESWGAVGGKQQSTSDTVREGKNIGRSNETSPEEQAVAEAKAKWEKKLKGHNYTEVRADAEAGKSSEVVEGGILPMLAHKYSEHGDKIKFPAYLQPKLDGHRMTCINNQLWTRSRKRMYSCPHIEKAVEALWDRVRKKGILAEVLDGEGYNHEYHNKFEELTHFLRQPKYLEGSEVIQYHIYDIAMPGKSFEERYKLLEELLYMERKDSPLVLVETIKVNNEDEMMEAFEQFLAQGYEGAIVRNASGEYMNKRSYDLQKIKEFDDGEYLIVDVAEGRGSLQKHGIFVCITPEEVRFEAKLKGPRDNLKQYWTNPKLAIGRMLTVQYQGLTTKNKVPRFPVGLRFATEL
jgi:DNA ligase-1